MPSKTDEKFEAEVMSRRLVAATVCSVFVSLVCFVCLLLPLSSLALPSLPSLLLSLSLAGGSCGWVTVWHSAHLSSLPSPPLATLSPFSLLASLPLPSSLRALLSLTLHSLLLTYSLARLLPSHFSSALTSCPHSPLSYCFSESHLFVLQTATITGLWLGFQYKFNSGNYVEFPFIFEDKSIQIKQHLKREIFRSLRSGWRVLRISLLFHVIFGGYVNRGISSLLLFPLDGAFSSYTAYLDIYLMMSAYVLVLLAIVTTTVNFKIFTVYATEAVDFPLSDILESLNEENSVHQLLLLDRLSLLCRDSPTAREAVFSLSQPGGHPHTWNTIKKSCLARLESTSSALNSVLNPPTKPAPVVKATPAPVSSPNPSIRRLVASNTPKSSSVEDLVSNPSTKPTNRLYHMVLKQAKDLQTKPGLSVVFEAKNNATMCAALAPARGTALAVSSLVHLVATSLTEDKYGVVQKDLPALLQALLSLDQALESCRGLGSNLQEDSQHFKLKQELRDAVRSGLYRIAVTFGAHIKAVPLPVEFQKKLNNFCQFLET